MKFSVRDLVLVTMIVALAVGWWVDRRAVARRDALRSEYIKNLKDALRTSLEHNEMYRMKHGDIRGLHRRVDLPPELENEPK